MPRVKTDNFEFEVEDRHGVLAPNFLKIVTLEATVRTDYSTILDVDVDAIERLFTQYGSAITQLELMEPGCGYRVIGYANGPGDPTGAAWIIELRMVKDVYHFVNGGT